MRRTVAIIIALTFGSLHVEADPPEVSPLLTAVRIDGTRVVGELESLRSDALVLNVDGDSTPIVRSELARIEFAKPRDDDSQAMPWTVEVLGGTHLGAELLEGRAESVVMKTRWADRIEIAFDQLAGIVSRDSGTPPAARALLDAARSDPVPGSDVLIAGGDEPKALRGTLLEISPSTTEFMFNDRARRLATDKVYAVVFAAQPRQQPQVDAVAHMAGGDVIAGTLLEASAASVSIRAGGADWLLPIAMMRLLELRSDRVVYLNELEPVSQKSTELVITNTGVRRACNVAGGPISLGGQTYERGIGMRSRSEVTYRLDAAYELFVATIGIDDAVRPNGSVEFVVRVDGKATDAAVVLTGLDEPRDIRIDVRGAAELTLIADFADNADVGDWADWADARLITPTRAGD